MPSHHGDVISTFDDLGAMLGLDLSGISSTHPPLNFPQGASIMGLGDSIINAGQASQNVLAGLLGRDQSGQNPIMHACLLSGGRLQYAGNGSIGGLTTSQILGQELPVVLTVKPQICVVHAGTNDFGNFSTLATFQQWQRDMNTIYSTLRTAGILPIACTLNATNNVGTTYTNLTRANVWIARNASRIGIPCVDMYGALAQDNGNYAAGLNSDNVHQSAAGAKVMGQAIWTLLQNFMPGAPQYIAEVQPGTDTIPILRNELFLTDSNADGVPDLWSVSGAPTTALATDTANFGARSGKVWTITRTAATGNFSCGNITVTPGNKLWFSIKFATTGVEAAGGQIDLYLAAPDLSSFLLGLFSWPSKDTAGMQVMTMCGEVVMPSNSPSNQINIAGAVRTGGAIKLAQPTLIDLTAAGIA